VDPESAIAIGAGVSSGALRAVDVVGAALERIDALDGGVGAFLAVFHDHAMARAREIDAQRGAGGRLGPLAGVPVALKDNICYDHGPTTCASRVLEGYRSPFAATAVRRLVEAGAVVVGKANLDEFGMGSSCEHSAFGPTRNPHAPDRVPGGSSGGSAAAVAAGMVPLALGSDTGGSIRQPASMCGVVGCKPTYGRVSRYGLVAFASSLDQIGPIAGSAEDCALALRVMAGRDPLDATSADRNGIGPAEEVEPERLVLGVPGLARGPQNDPEAEGAFGAALERVRTAGVEVRAIELPHASHAVAAYYVIAAAEAGSNLARYDGVRYGRRAALGPGAGLEELYTRSRTEGFGPEVRRRIMLGTHVLSAGYYEAYYATAMRARRLVAGDFAEAFRSGCHAVVMPTTPGPAFRIGEKVGDPLAMYAEDVYTVGASLAGLPAVSVPSGWVERDGTRLPVGLQLVGPAWGESALLAHAGLLAGLLGGPVGGIGG
jgi:aspartyl-tRNA(Asn)/glutamyl-tRNA(Gln) amidotransferase subunit A